MNDPGVMVVQRAGGDEQSDRERQRPAGWIRGTQVLVAALVALGCVVLPAGSAVAQGGFTDKGWWCDGNGVHVNMPVMSKANPNVRFEGAYVQPMVFRLDGGKWVIHSWNYAVASTDVYGLAPPSGFWVNGVWVISVAGGWQEHRTNRPLQRWDVGAGPGTYAVGYNYRWDSTGWLNYVSGQSPSGFTTCEIPK